MQDAKKPSLFALLTAAPFLMFAIIFTAIILVSFGQTLLAVTGVNKRHAEAQLKEWVIGTEYTARSCRNQDTDNNKYISCEVLSPKQEIVQVECAAPLTINTGCRKPKATTINEG